MANKPDMVALTDQFMIEILQKVRTVGDGVDVNTQIDFFKEMVRWSGMKSKIAPDSGEGSKLNEYRDALKAASSGSGRSGSSGRSQKTKKSASKEGGAGASEDDAGKSRASNEGDRIAALDFTDPQPSHGSFPVNGTGFRSGGNGHTKPGLAEDDGGGVL